jgi:hypothetical protein
MIYDLIRKAILEKKIVHATYKNQPREMCPHVLGRKNGKPQALFYQFGGESTSRPIEPDGSPVNWRCLELAMLSDVRLVDGEWHTAPNHSRPQTCVGEIDVAVDY